MIQSVFILTAKAGLFLNVLHLDLELERRTEYSLPHFCVFVQL